MVDVDERPRDEQGGRGAEHRLVVAREGVEQDGNKPEAREAEDRAGDDEAHEHGGHGAEPGRQGLVSGGTRRTGSFGVELIPVHHRAVLERVEHRHDEQQDRVEPADGQPHVDRGHVGDEPVERQHALRSPPAEEVAPDREGRDRHQPHHREEEGVGGVEEVVGEPPELLLPERVVDEQPVRDPREVGVPPQPPTLARAEPHALERRVEHEDAVALLGVVPADGEEHEVGGEAEERGAARAEHGGEERDEHRGDHDPCEAVAGGEPPAAGGRGRRERLAHEALVEELVGVREVGMVHEVGEEEHRARERDPRRLVAREERGEGGQDDEAPASEGQEVDPGAEQPAPRGAGPGDGGGGRGGGGGRRAGAEGEVDSNARVRHRQESLRRGRLAVFTTVIHSVEW